MKKLITVSAGIVIAAGCSANPDERTGHSGDSISVGAIFNFGTLSNPGSCLDARAAGTANGTQLQEWLCNGTGAQAYQVLDAGNGAFTLRNTTSMRCVDVFARGTANGTKVELYDCNGTPAQTFNIRDAGNGFVSFVNTNSGKCLDVAGNNPANGTVVQLWDCNGTNAQKWNPAVIGQGGGSSSGGGSSGGGSSGGSSGGGSGVRVHVANNCPIDLWIHAAGQEATLQPDNAHLAPGAARDYDAPRTWTSARINAYMQGPDGSGNPQGQSDKVEASFYLVNGSQYLNTDITYVDWVALPSQIQTFGSGSDCTTVGCQVPFAHILDGCPGSLLSGRECLSAGFHCLTTTTNDPYCHALDSTIARCASQDPGCGGAAGASTAQAYSCSGFFGGSPQFCAAVNRGIVDQPGAGTPASSFYKNPPFNTYAQWVHQQCPGIYAFPYDDFGSSSNQSSDHTCTGATQMNVTFCPKG